jgi:glycosyltransferase involved in cell wall biosynthesis
MKVLLVSKALVVGAYQRKLRELARHGEVEVVAVVPPSWRDRSYEMRLEQSGADGYELIVSPIVFNGSYHAFFFPRLGRILDEQRPDILHMDEEPYNLATFLAGAGARARKIPFLFFTWQNLVRSYPPPFRWMERFVYRSAGWAIAGTEAAARVLDQKGYGGPTSVIPQFVVDPNVHSPAANNHPEAKDRPFQIGFAGRLVPEKGVPSLVEACAQLGFDFHLTILGGGPDEANIRAAVRRVDLEDRVSIPGPLPSADMPAWLQALDVVVLPSLSRPNWVEQFGRILVEAMACGIPVVVSTCGELADVAGDGGLVFPEGDTAALAAALTRLASNQKLRRALAKRGRERVLQRFTYDRLVADTMGVYRGILESGGIRSGRHVAPGDRLSDPGTAPAPTG